VPGDVRHTQRLGVTDQLPEHTVAAGQRADRAPRLVADADREEPLERTLALVEDSECGIARGGELASGLEDLIEDCLEVELGNQRSTDRQQAGQFLSAKKGALRGQRRQRNP
jgi:hypothetical protein